MNDTIETHVTVNTDQELYVITGVGGYSCLGFDRAVEEVERIACELNARDPDSLEDIDAAVNIAKAMRGTVAGYDLLINARNKLREVCERAGEQAVAALSPQLMGLEGHRVEVTEDGETRRFVVGKSTGWMPCHLELSLRTSSDGPAARQEYDDVRDLGRVR